MLWYLEDSVGFFAGGRSKKVSESKAVTRDVLADPAASSKPKSCCIGCSQYVKLPGWHRRARSSRVYVSGQERQCCGEC